MFFSQPALRAARLLFAAAALLLPAAPTLAQGTIQINAIAIDYFDLKDRELRRFGKLEFRGGLQLTSSTREFGGISGLRIMPDGSGFLAVTDMGRWLRGRITYAGSAPSGIADAVMAPMLSADGKRLAARGLWDTEAIADDRGTIYVGIERKHQIVKFDFAKSGFKARAVAVPVPDEFKDFPNNEGIEALAIVPKGQPLAGTLIAITEKALDASGNIKGFLLGGPNPGSFSVRLRDDFSVTDTTVLPGGDLLLLERRYSPWRGAAVRLRRIAAGDLRPGATVDGEQLLYADVNQQVDNYEALGLHRTASGELVITIVSDDNFSPLQRTLLMQFTLTGE